MAARRGLTLNWFTAHFCLFPREPGGKEGNPTNQGGKETRVREMPFLSNYWEKRSFILFFICSPSSILTRALEKMCVYLSICSANGGVENEVRRSNNVHQRDSFILQLCRNKECKLETALRFLVTNKQRSHYDKLLACSGWSLQLESLVIMFTFCFFPPKS